MLTDIPIRRRFCSVTTPAAKGSRRQQTENAAHPFFGEILMKEVVKNSSLVRYFHGISYVKYICRIIISRANISTAIAVSEYLQLENLAGIIHSLKSRRGSMIIGGFLG